MNLNIANIVNGYYSPTELMYNSLKASDKEALKRDKDHDARHAFLANVMGKPLYKRCMNHGALDTFAPIPWTGIKLTNDDFLKLEKLNLLDGSRDYLTKFYKLLQAAYPKNQFELRGNEYYSDLVFNTIDSLIDFFYVVVKSINKAYKTNLDEYSINLKPICKKLNDYIK